MDGITYTRASDVSGDVEEYFDSGLMAGTTFIGYMLQTVKIITSIPLRVRCTCKMSILVLPPLNPPSIDSGKFFRDAHISGLNHATPGGTSLSDGNGYFFFGTDASTWLNIDYAPTGSIQPYPTSLIASFSL